MFFSNIKFFFYVFIFLAYSRHSFAVGKIEVNFYNVEQGNCTVVKWPNKGVMIIDGGTSSPHTAINRSKRASEISKEVDRMLTLPRRVDVVASHCDIDHYNLLQPILNGLTQVEFRFFLGGKEEDWRPNSNSPEETAKQSIKFLDFVRSKSTKVFFGSAFSVGDQLLWPEHPLSDPSLSSQIAALSAQTENENKNANSIILRLKFGSHSVLLTGDAPIEVTDKILESHPPKALESTIVQALHHGAPGENSFPWAYYTKPEYLVISAGQIIRYKHPPFKTLFLYYGVQNGRLKIIEPHEVTCTGSYFETSPVVFSRVTYPNGDNPFYKVQTRYAIFNTNNTNLGIGFSWDEEEGAEIICRELK